MCYFFVDAPAHCIKNALFVECVSASTKKSSAYMQLFFVDALAHYMFLRHSNRAEGMKTNNEEISSVKKAQQD